MKPGKYIRTPEILAKMSESAKGHVSAIKGKKLGSLSKEAKEKISKALKGRPSPLKGRKQTPEHIKKANDAKRGKPPTQKQLEAYKKLSEMKRGVPRSEETKRKLSEARKGIKLNLTEEQRRKISERSKGRVWSTEARLKMSQRQKGAKCYNWKGGATEIGNVVRHSFKYRLWRSDVFQRDDFTCQECFKRGYEIEAHHIKPFAKLLEENQIKSTTQADNCEELWNINNGITLCKECHKKTDSYAVKKRER